MEERYIQQLVQNLVERFEYLGVDNFLLADELNALVHPVTRIQVDKIIIDLIEDEFLTRVQYRKSHDEAILVPVSIVTDPRGHEEWYEEWLASNRDFQGSYYWKRLEDFLSRDLTHKYGPESAGRVVRSIDEATFQIMQKLASPRRKEFSYKGLVVGYVQSGKTANFTALIAKAADAGYKFIVVLAGIHNVLRLQTQVRLDRELTGERDFQNPYSYIDLPGVGKKWTRLTTANNEFIVANIGPFSSYCQSENPTIAVVKKNVRVLNRLIEYVSVATDALKANMPILIIDDEADQASVDTNANTPDTDPSRTNECIRTLLSQFTKKAYVGYTATPFANVLIGMTSQHGNLDDDLYPRNFIISLPEPEGYFGTTQIFQGNLTDRFVKMVPNEVNTLIQGTLTVDLSNAIDQFLLCCSVRNLRGDILQPMSMLVHVTHKIIDMSIVADMIFNYISAINGRYSDTNLNESLKNQFRGTWTNFQQDANAIDEELGLQNFIPEFDEIWIELSNVLSVLRILELNSESDDIIDYTTGREIKVIAIGGNQLSRGLTLEGLMTSYYLRESRQYDTLLQMGRWFGYRRNYEDLTRVHTTARIWSFFEHLALVEQELRSAIYKYEEDGITPAEMALAIRDHRTLNVTARNKMGAAQLRQSSYSESLNQTTWLALDQPDILTSNYNLGESFINDVNSKIGFANFNNNGVYIANEKLEGNIILRDFLSRYTFVDRSRTGGPGLDSESLIAYISRRISHSNPELKEWSVGVVGNKSPNYEGDPIKYGGLNINRVGRSRKCTTRGYNIGVLTESAHLKIDLKLGADNPYDGRSVQNPLLLLYLISKDSVASQKRPTPQLNERIDLFRDVNTRAIDVLGIAIVLPKSAIEPNDYIGQ